MYKCTIKIKPGSRERVKNREIGPDKLRTGEGEREFGCINKISAKNKRNDVWEFIEAPIVYTQRLSSLSKLLSKYSC